MVWEPVLPTDWAAPSTSALRRIADKRVQQYWDRGRLLSKAMGEKDKRSIVWDRVVVYAPAAAWDQDAPPAAMFQDGPVVRVVPAFTQALQHAVAERR